MIPGYASAFAPYSPAEVVPASLATPSADIAQAAQVAPAPPYNTLLPYMGDPGRGSWTPLGAYNQVGQRSQSPFDPFGLGYHLPVAALRGDQIWNDSFRQPYVGPLDFDNHGWGQPLETFEMRRQYRELYYKEPSVRSAVDGLTESVAVLDVSVLPQDPRNDFDCQAAEYFNWTVENTLLGWDGLITQTAKPAVIDGYSALEKVLNEEPVQEEQSRQWQDKQQLLHCRPLDTFWIKLQLDQFRNVLNVVNTVRGLQFYNVDKVILFSHSSLYGNPFGKSSLRATIRSCNLIQDAYQLWYLALKMYGLPYLHGKYQHENQRQMMEQALADLRSGGYAVTGIEDEIELLNLAAGASFTAFEANINKMREDNYLAIRGAYLPFLEGTGSPDSRGNTMVSKVASDAKSELLANQLGRLYTHQLAPWVTKDNFPRGTGYPIVVIGGTNTEEVAKLLDVGLTMAKEFGLPLSKQQLYKRGNWSPPDNDANDTVDLNQVQALQALTQGKVQLQLQAMGQQQQMAAQQQMQAMGGQGGGQQRPGDSGSGSPPSGGGPSGGAPPGGGGSGGGASDFDVQAEPFSEAAVKTFADQQTSADLFRQIAQNPQHGLPGSHLRLIAADAMDEAGETEKAKQLRESPCPIVGYAHGGTNGAELYVQRDSAYRHNDPTHYPLGMPEEVVQVLDRAHATGSPIILHPGTVKEGDDKGRDWQETYHVRGRVDRSTGRIRYPLLFGRARSGDPITHSVVRIRDAASGNDLYRHPNYHVREEPPAEQFSADMTPERFAAVAHACLADLGSVEGFSSDWTKLDRHPETGRWHPAGTLNLPTAPPKDEFAEDKPPPMRPAPAPLPGDTEYNRLEHTPYHTQADFHHGLVHTPEDRILHGVYADFQTEQKKPAHGELIRQAAQAAGEGHEHAVQRLAYHPEEIPDWQPGQFYVTHDMRFPQSPYPGPILPAQHTVILHQMAEVPHEAAPEYRPVLQWYSPVMDEGGYHKLRAQLQKEGALEAPQVHHGAGWYDPDDALEPTPAAAPMSAGATETFAVVKGATPPPVNPSKPGTNVRPKKPLGATDVDRTGTEPKPAPPGNIPPGVRQHQYEKGLLPPDAHDDVRPPGVAPKGERKIPTGAAPIGGAPDTIMPNDTTKTPPSGYTPGAGWPGDPSRQTPTAPTPPPTPNPIAPTKPKRPAPGLPDRNAADKGFLASKYPLALQHAQKWAAQVGQDGKTTAAQALGMSHEDAVGRIHRAIMGAMQKAVEGKLAKGQSVRVQVHPAAGGRPLIFRVTPKRQFAEDATPDFFVECFSEDGKRFATDPPLMRSGSGDMKTFSDITTLTGLLRNAIPAHHDDNHHAVVADALEENQPGSNVAKLLRRQLGVGEYEGQPRPQNIYHYLHNGNTQVTHTHVHPAVPIGTEGPFTLWLRHGQLPERNRTGGAPRWIVRAASTLPGSEGTGYSFEFPHEEAHLIPQMFEGAKPYIHSAAEQGNWDMGKHVPNGAQVYRTDEARRFQEYMDGEHPA